MTLRGLSKRFSEAVSGPPASLPIRLMVAFFLAHLFCLGWIASSETFLALSLLCAGWAVYRRELTVQSHVLLFPLALFLVASTLSAFHTADPLASLFHVSGWYTFLVFPLALTIYRNVPSALRRGVGTLTLLSLFLSGYGFVQYFLLGFGHRLLDKRITGPTAHVMTLSGIMLPLSMLLLVMALEERRLWTILATLLACVALVLTFTRGAWIGWLAGFSTVVIRRRPIILVWAVPLLLAAVTLSPLSVFGRLISTFDSQQSSNLDRIRMAEAGIEMIRDAPLLGIGPGHMKEIYPLYRKPDAPRFRIPHLHDNVLELWAERGILAMASYLLLLFLFLKGCSGIPREARGARMFADIGFGVTFSLTVAGLFEYNFGDSEVLLTMLNLFALCIAGIEASREAPAAGSPARPAALVAQGSGTLVA
jgi:putative inorganic carbon (HCO3(-)) transporter